MAGHMNLLNPFVFNQFGPYGAYAQVSSPTITYPPSVTSVGLIAILCAPLATTAGGSDGRRGHSAGLGGCLHEPNGRPGNANTSWPQWHRPAAVAALADDAQL